MEFLINVLSNVVANIVFWLILGIIAWIAIQVSQSRFLKFFSLERNQRIVVYLSNLWNPSTEKPEGYIISEHEFRASECINRLFGSAPFRLPELVRGLVDSFWLGKSVDVKAKISPLVTDKITFSSNMIIVGSVVRNSVRKHYFETASPYLSLSIENEVLNHKELNRSNVHAVITRGNRKGTTINGNFNFATIEKLYDREHNISVFMCVGYRGDSTWASVEYLVRHWQELYKKYQVREFALCLGFPSPSPTSYMTTYEEPIILDSLPL